MPLLPRLHLVEFEDLEWFPGLIRDYATDFLRVGENLFELYWPAVDKLAELSERTGERRLVDLCSGGGGPIPGLVRHLAARGLEFRATLTDLYPNLTAFEVLAAGSEGRIDYSHEPVDATNVPAELSGIRTLCSSIHHFRPDLVKKIFRDAVEAGAPLAVFDAVERRLVNLLSVLLVSPLGALLATPFIRPFRLTRLLFTYLVPAVPALLTWDGFVSMLRGHEPDELEACGLEVLDGAPYQFEVGRVPVPWSPWRITYLLGWPTS